MKPEPTEKVDMEDFKYKFCTARHDGRDPQTRGNKRTLALIWFFFYVVVCVRSRSTEQLLCGDAWLIKKLPSP